MSSFVVVIYIQQSDWLKWLHCVENCTWPKTKVYIFLYDFVCVIQSLQCRFSFLNWFWSNLNEQLFKFSQLTAPTHHNTKWNHTPFQSPAAKMVRHTTLCKSIANAWDVAKIKPFKIINWPFAFYFNSHLNIINFGLSLVAWIWLANWMHGAHSPYSVLHPKHTITCFGRMPFIRHRRRKVCNLNWISCNLLPHHRSNILWQKANQWQQIQNSNSISNKKSVQLHTNTSQMN